MAYDLADTGGACVRAGGCAMCERRARQACGCHTASTAAKTPCSITGACPRTIPLSLPAFPVDTDILVAINCIKCVSQRE